MQILSINIMKRFIDDEDFHWGYNEQNYLRDTPKTT